MSASEDDSSHLSIRSSNYDEGDEESHSAASTSNDFGTTTAASSTAGGSKSAADQEALCCGMSAITWVRVVVLLLIAGAAAAIGATTHVLLTNQETSAFQSEVRAKSQQSICVDGDSTDSPIIPRKYFLIPLSTYHCFCLLFSMYIVYELRSSDYQPLG